MLTNLLTLITAISCVPMSEIEAPWRMITGMHLRNVDASPGFRTVCGTNSSDRVFCASTDTFQWYRLPGFAAQVSTAKGQIYSVNSDREISYSASIVDGRVKWVNIPGRLKQISFDGNTICGIDRDYFGTIFCANKDITTNPNWFKLPVKVISKRLAKELPIKQVVVYRNALFAIDGFNQIFYSPTVEAPTWIRIPGSLKQIHYDGDELCGTDDLDQVLCAGATPGSARFLSDPNWKLIPQNLKQVSVGGTGRLIGVDSNDNIYVSKLPS